MEQIIPFIENHKKSLLHSRFVECKPGGDLILPGRGPMPGPGRNLTAAQTDGLASNSWLGLGPNQTGHRTKPIQAKSMQASRPLPVMAQLPQ